MALSTKQCFGLWTSYNLNGPLIICRRPGWNTCSPVQFYGMDLTGEQRKKIFEEGKRAAAAKQDRRACPYLGDETPERIYIWMGGYNSVTN